MYTIGLCILYHNIYVARRTVLMVTAENGHQAAFQYLLSRGANFSIRDKKGILYVTLINYVSSTFALMVL